jgi:hypothetical protein
MKGIGNYKDVGDWTYILLGILFVDVAVLFIARYYPDFLGKNLNIWYEQFGLNAVISDVFIIAIGFAITRHIYTYFFPGAFNIWIFLSLLVAVQAIHDILFYLLVILPIPRGHNRMIDVFKDYASGGPIIIAGDAGLMLGSAIAAMVLKGQEPYTVAFVGLLTVYALPYILETRNKYSFKNLPSSTTVR